MLLFFLTICFLLLYFSRHSSSSMNRMLYVTGQGLGGVASVDVKNVMLVRALLTARDILVEELQKISKAVDQAIDISEFVLQANQFAIDVEVSGQGKPQNGLQVLILFFFKCCRVLICCFAIYIALTVPSLLILCYFPIQGGALDFLNAGKLHSFYQNELLDCLNLLGDQLFYLRNIFFKFHRFPSDPVSLDSLQFDKDVWFFKFCV